MATDSGFPVKDIRFALGSGYNLGKAKNRSESLTKLSRRFQKPHVTAEKRHEYLKLTDKRKNYLKAQAGWFMRAHVEAGHRTRNTIIEGDLLTFDVDYATPEWQEAWEAGEHLPGFCHFGHTTRSHTPEKPRIRMMVPVEPPIPSDMYPAVNRIVAQMMDPDMQHIDKVSARVAQMMFMPTVSADMEKHYRYHDQGGKVLNWKKVVRDWERHTGRKASDLKALPLFVGEEELRASADKAEDPLTKEGVVGAFCRAYSITELVMGKDGEEGILADDYEITEWHEGSASRMTYLKGSTSNGAVVYDDVFVYSHHGSDPAQEQLCNAYDLVRIHLFGTAQDDPDSPMSERPSIKAMNKYVVDLPEYKHQLVEDRFDLDAYFDDDDDGDWIEEDDGLDDEARDLIGELQEAEQDAEDAEIEDLLGIPLAALNLGPDRYERQRAGKPKKDWVANLDLTQEGAIKDTLPNITTIVTNDPRWWRKIAHNEFSHQTVLLADLKSKTAIIPQVTCKDKQKGDLWSDFNDSVIRAVIESQNGRGKVGYGFRVTDRNLVGGIMLAGRNNSFHPIREMIEEWRSAGWDGVDRISTLLHDFLGAEKNAYMAEVLRLKLIASIARIETPGCKFDFAIILEGPQGIGKSTFIKALYGSDYFGEIDCDLGDRREVAEQIAGKWALELPELSSLHKADHNHAKQFMRRQSDDVRMAYGRTVTEFKRQNVIWGTTNDDTYLRDPTGNRSYWPVRCSGKQIDIAGLVRIRHLIWAQAVHEHDQMRREHPHGDLPLYLKGDVLRHAEMLQARARSTEMWEEWVQDIIEWASRPVRKDILLSDLGIDFDPMAEDAESLVRRIAFNQHQAAVGALGLREGAFTNPTQQLAWNKAKEELKKRGFEIKDNAVRIAGRQARWIVFPGASQEDRLRGYTLTDEAEPTPEDSDGEELL